MTVQTAFFDWGSSGLNWDAPPYETCSPNLLALHAHLEETWGGRSLGCHHDRTIVGGSKISDHAYGAALDWRYGDVMNRAKLLADVIPWLIDNSSELGIDAIHDYVGDRIWRAGRTSNVADAHTTWWRKQNGAGGQMGKSWAVWLHIATHRDRWADSTPIAGRLTDRRVDLLDISSWQTITKWADVPQVPIVHRCITNGNTLDTRFASRMPVISTRTDIYGAYVVLAAGMVAKQMAAYVDAMRPFWGPGAFTQLDVEPWDGQLISADELDEAIRLHDAAFGVGRLCVYMNPFVSPALWDAFVARHPDVPRWVPGYRATDDEKAARYGATIHQWTDEHRPSGFTGNVDANEIRDLATLKRIAGLTTPPGPPPSEPPPEENDMYIWSPKGYKNAFLIGAGPAIPVSPEAYKHLTTVDKVPAILQDTHKPTLLAVLHQSGLRMDDLERLT